MTRRTFAGATAAGAPLSAAQPPASKNRYIELRTIRMRNTLDNQVQRTTDFLSKVVLPAAQRAALSPVGFFSSVIAEDSPFILVVTSYPTLGAIEEAAAKLASDKQFLKDQEAYFSAPGPAYVRQERSLLRAFDTMPAIEVPASDPKRTARIFELRRYESNSSATLRRKIKMFDEGEIAIFRKTGLQPVFFGETIFGTNVPNLTYLLAFDDLAARERNWRTFVAHPEWQKLRSQPGLSDAEIVSNISNAILRPLPFSEIR